MFLKRCWLSYAVVLFLTAVAWSQSQEVPTHEGHVGIVTDWTSSHLVISGGLTPDNLRLAGVEPRVRFQLAQRFQQPTKQLPLVFGASNETRINEVVPDTTHLIDGSSTPDTANQSIDWSVSLGAGNLVPYQWPAKYGFYPNATPDCVNDWVVFPLDVVGVTGGQANLVGINQLYSGVNPTGLCGTAPHVNWAYNGSTANGKVLTSPSPSLDGTKVAYIESAGGAAVFHILTWHAGDGTSATAAAVPTPVGSCTVSSSCLLSVTYSPSVTVSQAFLWIDWSNDRAYVASDNQTVYRISCVFHCPLNTNPTVDWKFKLPVAGTGGKSAIPTEIAYDNSGTTGYLMVADDLGEMWIVNAGGVTPSLAFGPVMIGGGGCTTANPPGRTGTPVPCTANGQSFGVPMFGYDESTRKILAVSGNDGTPGASATVVQMGVDLSTQVRVHVGLGSVGNTTTNVDLHDLTLDYKYFSTTPASGHLFVCGTGANDTTPWRYRIGFANYPLMDSIATQETQQVATAGVPCHGYEEFYNPNINLDGNTNDHDLMIGGLIGASFNGNIILDDISNVPAEYLNNVNYPGGVSGVVIDNNAAAQPYPQASSMYFSTLGVVTVGSCINARCAVKLSQLNLQ